MLYNKIWSEYKLIGCLLWSYEQLYTFLPIQRSDICQYQCDDQNGVKSDLTVINKYKSDDKGGYIFKKYKKK